MNKKNLLQLLQVNKNMMNWSWVGQLVQLPKTHAFISVLKEIESIIVIKMKNK